MVVRSWVREEVAVLVHEYQTVGLISTRQREALVELVHNGDEETALRLLTGLRDSKRR